MGTKVNYMASIVKNEEVETIYIEVIGYNSSGPTRARDFFEACINKV